MTLAELMLKLLASARMNDRGCLLVGSSDSKQRYWSLRIGGVHYYAHQAAWEFYNGRDIPEGMCVLHRCDNTRCIAGEHLFLGTTAENMRDRDSKGRNGTLGDNCPLSRLTSQAVLEIRAIPSPDSAALAAQYQVSIQTINRIISGTTWRHLLPAIAA